jgi:hypothetical protein
MRKILWLASTILGLYLVARAIAEPFVIDFGDPMTYRNDWGGPSVAGVLAVHCGPGVAAAGFMVTLAVRRRFGPRDQSATRR